ncbi:MAG: hypothetical protein ACE5F9_02195 [Phycisphaerae bacterium]
MFLRRKPVLFLFAAATLITPTVGLGVAWTDSEPAATLHTAYYLEHEARDFAAAADLYRKVLDGGATDEVRRAAQAGADRCRDQRAAEDFATIMPADAVVYLELRRPGELVRKLADMLGLTGSSVREILAARPNANGHAPFHIPQEVAISPALFDYFESFGGAAAALTQINPGGQPEGVLVVHHGDTDLLRGVIETAFQFAPTAERIRELPTFGGHFPGGSVSGVLTESLFIVGSSRDLVSGVVGRLLGDGGPSLSSREDLKAVAARRSGATFYAFVDLQRAVRMAREQAGDDDRDMAIADALVDLDSLRWATFSAGIDDGVMGMEFVVRLAEDHRNLVYNLMRLPPMTRQCLSLVPEGAAGFIGLGLNPALANVVGEQAGHVGVTGLDIGREVFGNIRELCAFVVPGKAGGSSLRPMPNVGLIMAVNDRDRSRAFWSQILTIPGMIAGAEPTPPKRSTIGSTPVTVYHVPEIGRVYMADIDGCIAIGLTRNAMKAAIRTKTRGTSVLDDPILGEAIADLPADSSAMLVGHVGRLSQVVAAMMPTSGVMSLDETMGVRMAASQAVDLCKGMVFWVGLGQSPNQMSLRLALRGLPNVNAAIKRFGPMANAAAGMAARGAAPVARERTGRPIERQEDGPERPQ